MHLDVVAKPIPINLQLKRTVVTVDAVNTDVAKPIPINLQLKYRSHPDLFIINRLCSLSKKTATENEFLRNTLICCVAYINCINFCRSFRSDCFILLSFNGEAIIYGRVAMIRVLIST